MEAARIGLAALCLTLAWETAIGAGETAIGAEEPSANNERFAPVAFLADRCWLGRFPDSQLRDVHCWEWAIANRFLRNRHQVSGSKGVVYQGETLYGWDARDEVLRYWYFNSLGGVSEGTVEHTEDGWMFREQHRGSPEDMELQTAFTRHDKDSYSVKTQKLTDGEWKPFGEIAFEACDDPSSAINTTDIARGHPDCLDTDP